MRWEDVRCSLPARVKPNQVPTTTNAVRCSPLEQIVGRPLWSPASGLAVDSAARGKLGCSMVGTAGRWPASLGARAWRRGMRASGPRSQRPGPGLGTSIKARATTAPPGCHRPSTASRFRRVVAGRQRSDPDTPRGTGRRPVMSRTRGRVVAFTSMASRRSPDSITKSTSRSVVVRQNSTSGAGAWPSRQTSRSTRTRFSRCVPLKSVVLLSQIASAGSLR